MTSVYDIAIGTKRTQLTTKPYRWEWHELVERLRNVERTGETMAQYQAMSKAQRLEVKDVGFIIGGFCDKRKVICRQLLVCDIDETQADTLDKVRVMLGGASYVIHSTHSSTPERPRYRIVTPLSRIVSADEYAALMRIVCEKFEIPLDVATFDFNRIMFLPSVPNDAEYYFEEQTAGELDVDALLAEAGNWRDLTGIGVPKKAVVQDPKYKKGFIGAFCAAFTIREALATYLSDVWIPYGPDRYTLAGASTVGGGVIYEDKYLYSNHASDPYLGHCHNAYDAVRLYKFGDDKQGEAAMVALCEGLGLKIDSMQPHRRTVEQMDEPAKTILNERLEVDKNGSLKKTLRNAELIFENDPQLRGLIAYDMFSEQLVLRRTPFWRAADPKPKNEDCRNLTEYEEMSDIDESYIRLYFEEDYGFDARNVLNDALNITGHKNAFHPIRDYLDSLQWDGTPRLERIFIDCFGVEDTLYAREVGKKFFTGAVRRVFIPAAKMDYVPVLVSEEGLGKSKFIRRMAKMWGSDTFYTFSGSKEAYEQLRGVWLMEIPELNGVQSRSTNSRKAFVTKSSDRYRAAYLKYTKTYKRQCVFIASSNDMVFMDDPSEDGRRWWGLVCHRDNIKVDVHSDEFLDLVDQYWAEAVHYYTQGVLPVLSREAETEAGQTRILHRSEDSEQGALINYLNMPVPPNWYSWTVFERKTYISNLPDTWYGKPRDLVCIPEIAREFYGYERKELTPKSMRQIADSLRRTGLFEQTVRKRSFGCYGSCLAWLRKDVNFINKN